MKILYCVNGEGMGHSIRSKTIIDELKKHHTLYLVASGKAYRFFSKKYPLVRVGSFNITYRNNSVDYLLTTINNIIKLPFLILHSLRLISLFLRFRPDVVITDVEPFGAYYSYLFRKKCISLDNQHIFNTKLDKKTDFLIDKLVSIALVPKADHYLVTTFFYPKKKNKKTLLFPPVIRKQIQKKKPKDKGHILVYQTSKSDRSLVPTLKKLDQDFILYSRNKEKQIKNIKFKRFSEKEFIKDLAGCRAVITNGGFTVISEALYLQKPILSVPVKNQYEQIRNAIHLQRAGYGMHCKEISYKNIERFLSNINTYKNNLRTYKKQNNNKIIDALDRLLRQAKS
ncbi:hypothetical protein GF336_06925 [Candidatus Woesearchaeota archaeon]|nr:hypothetical protein [Candidatus Woesearchaeota archaeon]